MRLRFEDCVFDSGTRQVFRGGYGVATTVEVDSFGLELPFKAVQ
jgi:hypothetical protein